MIATELLRSRAELHGHLDDWSKLARDQAKPFQSPEWLLPWWDQFGTGQMRIAIARSGHRLLGVLACYVLEEANGRKLLPIGAGLTDHLDALIDRDAPTRTASMLLATVLDACDDVTACDLIDLPPDASLRLASVPAGWHDALIETTPCPVVTWTDAPTDLRQAIPSSTHRKLRMNRHRATRHGGWVHAVANEAELHDALETLIRLHAARWAGRDQPGGVFADARVGAWVRQAAPALRRNGMLALHVLRFGANPVAACLSLEAGRDLLLYGSGFDGEYAFCSPGSILLGEIMESAMRERRPVHFLRGGEGYKYGWGAVDRFNAVRRLTRP